MADENNESYEMGNINDRQEPDDYRLRRYSSVEASVPDYMWTNNLARGTITIITGLPGTGKSFLTTEVASGVSTGQPFPGSSEVRQPGVVLFQNGEDSPSYTIRPRLEKAGANLDNVFFVEESFTGREFNLQDTNMLLEIMEEVHPDLIVIDPIQQYLGPKVDINRADKLRPILKKLAQIASTYNCCVVIVMHLNKGSGKMANNRILGSIDFQAAARSILLVGKNPSNPDERVVLQTKNNNGPVGPAYAFRLSSVTGFEWLGESDLTETALMSNPVSTGRSSLEKAEDLIRSMLRGGPVSSTALYTESAAQGISKRTVDRARHLLSAKQHIYTIKLGNAWMIGMNDIAAQISTEDKPS